MQPNLKHYDFFCLFSLVFVYLMGGQRQLFFFQHGPEMPKGWTPLRDGVSNEARRGHEGNECRESRKGMEAWLSEQVDLAQNGKSLGALA